MVQCVQWLGLRIFTVNGTGSIPGQGTKILQAKRCGQKKKKKFCQTLEHKAPVSPCLALKEIFFCSKL